MIAADMVGCYEYGWQVSARLPARGPRSAVTFHPGAVPGSLDFILVAGAKWPP
jgi:hypothetical protein